MGIFLSNLIFISMWIYFLAKDLRLIIAKKAPKIFRICCLCCNFKRLDEAVMAIRKNEQDA